PYATLAPSAPVTTSANGYTLTIYPVSADPGRVLITYTLMAPLGHNADAIYFANGITQYWDLDGPTLQESNRTHVSARAVSASSQALDEPADVGTPAPSVSSTKAMAFD